MSTPVRAVTSTVVNVGDSTKASHYNNLRIDFILALTEYDYGDTVDLPATPDLGQRFMDKEADILYACFDAGTWQAIASDVVSVTSTGVINSGNEQIIGSFRVDQAIALGGGSTPTFGTIGGSGPQTVAQNEWLEVSTQNGVRWIPLWA